MAKKVAACGKLTAVTAVLPTLWLGSAGNLVAVPVRGSSNLHSWGVVAIDHQGIGGNKSKFSISPEFAKYP
jgi:hypothetical protein